MTQIKQQSDGLMYKPDGSLYEIKRSEDEKSLS